MEELLKDFLNETAEQLDAIGAQFPRFEQDPSDARVVANIFRLVHAIKGASGFLNLPRLERLARAAELLMDGMREGSVDQYDAIGLAPPILEKIKSILRELSRTGREPFGDDESLIVDLENVARSSRPSGDDIVDLGPSSLHDSRLSTRVSVKALDRLHSSVADLMSARDHLLATMKAVGAPELSSSVARLMNVASDLNASLMLARKQPVERLFASLRRHVAELSARLGKKARLNVRGGCLELDGQWLDAMREPLIRLVSALIADGLESPRERSLAGKAETGTLEVSVALVSGAVLITISDDGRAREMGEAEDDVRLARERIELLDGSINWAAGPGGGAIVAVRVPLNLPIASVFTVFVGGQRFAVRSSCVDEVVALHGDGARDLLERDGQLMLRTPDGFFPCAFLRDIMHIDGSEGGSWRDSGVALRMSVGARAFAVIADHACEAREIVLKPLPKSLRRLCVFGAAAILDDGAVALELDSAGLAGALGLSLSIVGADARRDEPRLKRLSPRNLVFRAHGDSKSLPLAALTRVLNPRASDIEFGADGAELWVEGRRVPLVRIDGGRVISIASAAKALVIARDDHHLALLVDDVEVLEDDENMGDEGLVMDTLPLFHRHSPGFDAPSRDDENALLVLEPIPFFGELIAGSLIAAGYIPVVIPDVAGFISSLAKASRRGAVLLDLDVAETGGAALARQLRAMDPGMTMIGLASHAGPSAWTRARAAGLSSVVGKFDREALRVALSTKMSSSRGGIAA